MFDNSPSSLLQLDYNVRIFVNFNMMKIEKTCVSQLIPKTDFQGMEEVVQELKQLKERKIYWIHAFMLLHKFFHYCDYNYFKDP